MGNISSITEQVGNATAALNEFISDNKSTIGIVGVGVGGAVVGSVLGYAVAKKSSSTKRKSKSRSSRKGNGRSRDRKYISKQKHEQRYLKSHPKRKKTGKYYKSRKGKVKYTKKGQPYILLKSGKARFIKKKNKR